MNQLNSIILEGNVVRKPRLKEGTVPYVEFNIDVHRYVRDREGDKEISYRFQIAAYGDYAENVVNYASKGRGLRVVGRLSKNGSKILVVAEHIEWKPKAPKKKVQK